MEKLGLLLFLAAFCLVATEALLAHRRQGTNKSELEEVTRETCVPGKFYKKGCRRCFCDDKKRAICGHTIDCKVANQAPKNPSFLRPYSFAELERLPSLPHQSVDCTPGASYRVDCDACICLANKNLMCNDVLCPSYDDMNRIMAKELTGQKCSAENTTQTRPCITCTCIKGLVQCEADPQCDHHDGRREFQVEPPLDLSKKTEMRKCTKGMVYKRDCNRCYCQQDNTIRCTLMRCLKHTEVQRLKKLRTELEREGL